MKIQSYYQGCGQVLLPDFSNAQKLLSKKSFIVEEKYDGIYCSFFFNKDGSINLISRPGKDKTSPKLKPTLDILSKMVKDLNLYDSVFIGELFFGTQPSKEFYDVNGFYQFVFYDIVRLRGEDVADMSVYDRKKILDLVFVHNISYAKHVSEWSHYVFDGDVLNSVPYIELQKWFNRIIESGGPLKTGGEGLVLKEYYFSGITPMTKPKEYIKLKKWVTKDYIILGFTESESEDYKSKGYVGGIKLGLNFNDITVEVGVVGSMSDEWRMEFGKNGLDYIGSVVEVKGFEVFKSGMVRHPSFVRLHPEKEPYECVLED